IIVQVLPFYLPNSGVGQAPNTTICTDENIAIGRHDNGVVTRIRRKTAGGQAYARILKSACDELVKSGSERTAKAGHIEDVGIVGVDSDGRVRQPLIAQLQDSRAWRAPARRPPKYR